MPNPVNFTRIESSDRTKFVLVIADNHDKQVFEMMCQRRYLGKLPNVARGGEQPHIREAC